MNVKAVIAGRIKRAGSMRRLARELGVSAAYISDVMRDKRNPGPAILDPLGIECVATIKVIYRRKQPS